MKRHSPPFTGVWPALVTPFDAQGCVSRAATRRLLARLIEQGAAGLYICGSTGEAPLLDVADRKELTECVIQEVAGQLPVMVHVGHTAPVAAAQLAEHAARCGADAISATLPPFYSYTPGQVAAYWADLAGRTDLPFYGYVMHDIGGSSEQISRWLEAMSTVPNLAGFKFTYADPHPLSLLKSWRGGKLNILSGHDQGYLGCRVQGAEGAIGTTYNIALPMWVRVCRYHEQGQAAAAAEMMARCCELIGMLVGGYILTKVKLVLARQGFDCGRPRLPLRADVEIPAEQIERMVTFIEEWSRREPAALLPR